MARSRNIKPGFFTNDELGELNPLSRLLFAGMWCHADREGRLLDRPKKLKAEVLPYDKCDADDLLRELESTNFVKRYEANGVKYIQCVNFSKHQNPHVKEPASEIPAPDESGSSLMLTPEQSETSSSQAVLIPSSLIPDSLIPSKALSGKPDAAPEKQNKKAFYRQSALEILSFLNEKTGKAFRPVSANIDPIVLRLMESGTVTECRQIIVRKCREWSGEEKTRVWLRPETLFRKSKFAQYQGELVAAPEDAPRETS